MSQLEAHFGRLKAEHERDISSTAGTSWPTSPTVSLSPHPDLAVRSNSVPCGGDPYFDPLDWKEAEEYERFSTEEHLRALKYEDQYYSCEEDEWDPAHIPQSEVIFSDTPLHAMPTVTEFLTGERVTDMYRAAYFAALIGACLNVRIVISWSSLGLLPMEVEEAARNFRKRLQKWAVARGYRSIAYVDVFECGPRNLLHSHMVVHVRNVDKGAFYNWLPGAVRGSADTAKGIKSNMRRRVMPERRLERQPPKALLRQARRWAAIPPKAMDVDFRKDRDVRSQWYAFKYMAKGIDFAEQAPRFARSLSPTFAQMFRLRIKQKLLPVLAYERVTIARAINKSAQRKWRGYVDGNGTRGEFKCPLDRRPYVNELYEGDPCADYRRYTASVEKLTKQQEDNGLGEIFKTLK